MSKGTHDYTPDTRNASIRISINGELVPREEAKVSVFDAGYVLGDGVWAPHWYASVERSTGFAPYRECETTLARFQQKLADACRPFYDKLVEYAIAP